MADISLPPFPKDFFGGLSAKGRAKGETPLCKPRKRSHTKFPSGCIEANVKGTMIMLNDQSDFAVPMYMTAYFSCYTRSKWPLFNAWVVAPELQSEDKVQREGTFGNVPKDTQEYRSFHGKMPNEILRSGDVKGVWSDYFGFDQGHWAPDAPFRMKKDLVESTYYYVNVSPQTACLNRQEWEHLESSIRLWAVSKNIKVSVMAGPLETLPEFFIDSAAKQHKWRSLLEQWRVAGEVLMRGVEMSGGMKDPHWVEVMNRDGSGNCILRGFDNHASHMTLGVEREELRDLAGITACNPATLLNGLGEHAFYLMTQAGLKANRRGVRVPLGYWKVASWKQGQSQVYCCFLMDQVGLADMTNTGDNCITTIKESFDVIPGGIKHAGKETCEALFTPRGGLKPEQQQAQDTMDCDFYNAGIGWRGNYVLDENNIEH